MLFSIIVPSFNQAQYLRATLESILTQRDAAFEIIVMDGGSRDGSVDVLRSFATEGRLTWVSEPDFGQAHAINKGLRRARGEILAYLNSDDIYFPAALASVADAFAADSDALFVYGDAHHLNADGSFLESYYTEAWDYERLQQVCFLCQPAVFWRREALDRFGFFDDTLHFAMDYEYWLRAGAHTPFRHLSGVVLAGSRLHESTKTLSQRVPVHRECLDVVARHATSNAGILTWLRHLAHHEAVASGKDAANPVPQPVVFAQRVLTLASEFGIVPDESTLRMIDQIIADHTPTETAG